MTTEVAGGRSAVFVYGPPRYSFFFHSSFLITPKMTVSKSKVLLATGILGLLLTIFGILCFTFGHELIKDQVIKNVKIDPNSGMSYTMWRDIPVPFFMSIYFLEVLNPDEVLKGEKPMVHERGPYVYREYRQKSNITFHENSTVSYREYRRYYFWRNMSIGGEDDIVCLPNMLVLGSSILMENKSYLMKLAMSATFKAFDEKPFIKKTVGEILWGYEDPLVDFLNKFFPNMIPFKGKFGFFAHFNNSDSGEFTVFTGDEDIEKVHMVDTWNGMKTVNYWRSDGCNMINGTAGQMWPPFLTPSRTLQFYSPDACRSMELVYEQSGVSNSIPVYRYIAPKTLFANGTDYPPNEGFCPCRQSGILNVSTCRFDTPMFLSHPHFYNGDRSLADAVDGLDPNEEDHSLFIDLHPMTGIPVNCSIKLQLNLFMKKVEGISETGSIAPVVMPLFWFSESGYIDGPILKTFYTNLVLLPALMDYMQYILLVVGGLLVLIAIILAVIYRDECNLFWCSNKKAPASKVASNGHSEIQATTAYQTVLQEARF
ncbi:scavenger receptor class B member 1 isoform X1 [Protopterus annectens]|uniref:scavenger receptor class B member 1 isoform X1 n=1 Tax=Protopterus annectens TaxID=7888 RepID=UPI001CFC338F|nr:scavenger receptor class B member 1 isoform X1 [Protopterus annectens]